MSYVVKWFSLVESQNGFRGERVGKASYPGLAQRGSWMKSHSVAICGPQRKGQQSGPSGMIWEHLRPLLDCPRDTNFLCVASFLARGDVPPLCRQIDCSSEEQQWRARHCRR